MKNQYFTMNKKNQYFIKELSLNPNHLEYGWEKEEQEAYGGPEEQEEEGKRFQNLYLMPDKMLTMWCETWENHSRSDGISSQTLQGWNTF